MIKVTDVTGNVNNFIVDCISPRTIRLDEY